MILVQISRTLSATSGARLSANVTISRPPADPGAQPEVGVVMSRRDRRTRPSANALGAIVGAFGGQPGCQSGRKNYIDAHHCQIGAGGGGQARARSPNGLPRLEAEIEARRAEFRPPFIATSVTDPIVAGAARLRRLRHRPEVPLRRCRRRSSTRRAPTPPRRCPSFKLSFTTGRDMFERRRVEEEIEAVPRACRFVRG